MDGSFCLLLFTANILRRSGIAILTFIRFRFFLWLDLILKPPKPRRSEQILKSHAKSYGQNCNLRHRKTLDLVSKSRFKVHEQKRDRVNDQKAHHYRIARNNRHQLVAALAHSFRCPLLSLDLSLPSLLSELAVNNYWND